MLQLVEEKDTGRERREEEVCTRREAENGERREGERTEEEGGETEARVETNGEKYTEELSTEEEREKRKEEDNKEEERGNEVNEEESNKKELNEEEETAVREKKGKEESKEEGTENERVNGEDIDRKELYKEEELHLGGRREKEKLDKQETDARETKEEEVEGKEEGTEKEEANGEGEPLGKTSDKETHGKGEKRFVGERKEEEERKEGTENEENEKGRDEIEGEEGDINEGTAGGKEGGNEEENGISEQGVREDSDEAGRIKEEEEEKGSSSKAKVVTEGARDSESAFTTNREKGTEGRNEEQLEEERRAQIKVQTEEKQNKTQANDAPGEKTGAGDEVKKNREKVEKEDDKPEKPQSKKDTERRVEEASEKEKREDKTKEEKGKEDRGEKTEKTTRKESEAKKQGSKAKKQESESSKLKTGAKRRESAAGKQDSEPGKQDSEVKRRESKAKRQESESRRQELESRKQKAAARRQASAARKQNLELRKRLIREEEPRRKGLRARKLKNSFSTHDLPASVSECFQDPSLLSSLQARLLSLVGRGSRYQLKRPSLHPVMSLEALRRKVKEARLLLLPPSPSSPTSSTSDPPLLPSNHPPSPTAHSTTLFRSVTEPGSRPCDSIKAFGSLPKYWGGEAAGERVRGEGGFGGEEEIELLQQYLSLQQLAISRKHSAQLRQIRDSLISRRIRSRPCSIIGSPPQSPATLAHPETGGGLLLGTEGSLSSCLTQSIGDVSRIPRDPTGASTSQSQSPDSTPDLERHQRPAQSPRHTPDTPNLTLSPPQTPTSPSPTQAVSSRSPEKQTTRHKRTPKADRQQLRDFLLDVGFVQYYNLLNRHGYDLPTAAHMDALDLAGAGITEPLHRMALKFELDLVKQPPKVPDEVPETIEEWLRSLSLEDYTENFHQNGLYCPLAAVGLSKRDLQLMGVYMQGHRKKILLALSGLSQALFKKE